MRKRTTALLSGLLLVGTLALTGCTPGNQFMPVGGKMNIQDIQHDDNNTYEVSVINGDNSVVWHRIGTGDSLVAGVYLVKDLKQPYIERVQDSSHFGLGIANYKIYEPTNFQMKAGSYRSSKTTVKGEMIYSGSSQ